MHMSGTAGGECGRATHQLHRDASLLHPSTSSPRRGPSSHLAAPAPPHLAPRARSHACHPSAIGRHHSFVTPLRARRSAWRATLSASATVLMYSGRPTRREGRAGARQETRWSCGPAREGSRAQRRCRRAAFRALTSRHGPAGQWTEQSVRARVQRHPRPSRSPGAPPPTKTALTDETRLPIGSPEASLARRDHRRAIGARRRGAELALMRSRGGRGSMSRLWPRFVPGFGTCLALVCSASGERGRGGGGGEQDGERGVRAVRAATRISGRCTYTVAVMYDDGARSERLNS